MRTIIDTTAGAGESLKAGGDKLNAMAAELYAKADSLLGGRKARIATLGESHGTTEGIVNAILYSLWRYYPADVIFDYRTFQDQAAFSASRGDIYAIGGTNTTHLVNTQMPKFEAAAAAGRIYDLVYIAAGFNDQVNDLTRSQATATNIIAAANRCLATGTRLVVICGLFPNGTSAATDDCNTRLRVFANITPGVAFCDLTRVMADPNAPAGSFRFKGATNTYLGYTTDGTHASGYARRMIAREFEHYHRAIARRRVPRRGFNTGPFDQVNGPGCDVTGDAGNMAVAAGGGLIQQSSYTTDVAGAEQGVGCLSLTWSGITATPSIITGADGFKRQRIAFSGATGGNAGLQFFRTSGITNLNNGVLTRAYDFEMVVELNAVSGLGDLFLRPANSSSSDTPYFGNSNGNPADLWPDGSTETLFMYTTVPETFPVNQANPYPSLTMVFGNRAPAGSIDVSRISFKRISD